MRFRSSVIVYSTTVTACSSVLLVVKTFLQLRQVLTLLLLAR